VDTKSPEEVEALGLFVSNDIVTGSPTAAYVAFNNYMNFNIKNSMS